MRVEQYNRYLGTAGEDYAPATMEDTVSDEEGTPVDTSHRNYDEKVLIFLPGGTLAPFSLHVFVQKTWPDGGDAGGCAFPEHGPARSRVQEAHAVALGDLARAFHRGARSFLNILVEGAGARALQETIPADRGDARGLLRVEALRRSSVVLGIFSLCWEAERAMLAKASHEVLPGGAASS